MATFENRIKFIEKNNFYVTFNSFQDIKIDHLNKFQNEALERFLFYIDLFQQASKIVKNSFRHSEPNSGSTDAMLTSEFNNKIIQQYLKLDIPHLRKKFGFKDYGLYLDV